MAVAVGITTLTSSSCIPGHVQLGVSRPSQIAGEWVDVAKSSPSDTSIWVLRADGYDGNMHVRITTDSTGMPIVSHKEVRYGSWYLQGAIGDTTQEALCFARRVGRFGATCIAFAMDTVRDGPTVTRRLLLRGYRGEHHTSDRVLIARAGLSASPQ